jgi:hypothetical protein
LTSVDELLVDERGSFRAGLSGGGGLVGGVVGVGGGGLEEGLDACMPTRDEVTPTICFWLLALTISLLIDHWLYLVATIGSASVVALMFFCPSLLYFRLGLLSDFQAKPLFGSVVPNRLYMNLVSVLGVGLLIFNTAACICFVVFKAHLAQKDG